MQDVCEKKTTSSLTWKVVLLLGIIIKLFLNLTAFFINSFNWKSKDYVSSSGFISKFLGKIKNVNYEAKNVSNFKTDTTNELFGGLGYLAKIDLFKEDKNEKHF